MIKEIWKLQEGKVIVINGISVKKLDKELEVGDFYVAERNIGPRLLQCESVNTERHWVNPTVDTEYRYDTWECIPVEIVEN